MARVGNVYYDGVLCGVIRELDDSFEFKYDETWLNSKEAKPISLTMPLQVEPYTSNILFPFFDGLIPEGWLLDLAIKKWDLDPMNRMDLLLTVCHDPIGAVSVEEMKE